MSVSGAKAVPGLPEFPGTYSYPPTPLLLVRGAPPFGFAAPLSAPIFAEAHAPKFLLTVTNGVHVPLLVNDAGGRTSLRAVTAFFDRYLKSRHRALAVLLHQGQDPSIATLQAVTHSHYVTFGFDARALSPFAAASPTRFHRSGGDTVGRYG